MPIGYSSLATLALAGLLGSQAVTPDQEPVPSPPEQRPSSEAADVAERSALARQIHSQLAAQPDQLEQRMRSLSLVKTTSFSGTCKNVKGFQSSSVRKAYKHIRDEALGRFGAEDAAAAKAELEARFPALPPAGTSECFGATPVYSEAQVSGLWAKIREWFTGAEKFSLLIDVVVRSTPSATATLRPAAGVKTYGPGWTEYQFPQLFRGTYRLSVTQAGYKPFDGEIRLSDADAPKVRCELVLASGTGESKCALEQ
jgi:hypothetical protein